MNEQPRGCTGETCKAGGTYVSEHGAREYYVEGQPFGACPETGGETHWTKVT